MRTRGRGVDFYCIFACERPLWMTHKSLAVYCRVCMCVCIVKAERWSTSAWRAVRRQCVVNAAGLLSAAGNYRCGSATGRSDVADRPAPGWHFPVHGAAGPAIPRGCSSRAAADTAGHAALWIIPGGGGIVGWIIPGGSVGSGCTSAHVQCQHNSCCSNDHCWYISDFSKSYTGWLYLLLKPKF